MTRSEAYAEGFQEGRRIAEDDISERRGRMDVRLLARPSRMSDSQRADEIGYCRGYRDTWARWDSGALTWEMLEHAPVNR